MTNQDHIDRLRTLFRGVFGPEPGLARVTLALFFGVTVHIVFLAAVIAMVLAMFFGMSESFGKVPYPFAIMVNSLLVIQFPIAHSLLLSGLGKRFLSKVIPGPHGRTLSSTTFAIIASLQLFVLFAFWTPSGIVWFRAEGWVFWALCVAYGLSWLLLMKASWDAGAEVQAGALGWMTLMKNSNLRFPDMPTSGLFKFIRQPIYLSFALTLWTVPIWTPDQLVLALVLSAYCLAAPKLKERRFKKRYGERFARYQQAVPYMVPSLNGARHDETATQ